MMAIESPSRGLLAMLSPKVKAKVLALAAVKHVSAGETIFHEGEHSRYVYMIDSGRVSLTLSTPPRGSRTVMTLGPGDLFSWSAMVEPYRETCTAKAFEDSRIIQLPAGELIALCRSNHDIGFEMYRAIAVVLATRVRALQTQLVDVFAPV